MTSRILIACFVGMIVFVTLSFLNDKVNVKDWGVMHYLIQGVIFFVAMLGAHFLLKKRKQKK